MKYKLNKKFYKGTIHTKVHFNDTFLKKLDNLYDVEELFMPNDRLAEYLEEYDDIKAIFNQNQVIKEIFDDQARIREIITPITIPTIDKDFLTTIDQFKSILNPIVSFSDELNKINEIIQPFHDFSNIFNDDFTEIIKQLPEYEKRTITKTLHIINQAEKHQWFLDFDLIDEFIEQNQSDALPSFDETFAIEFIEKNFDYYINEIKKCDSFRIHQSIFEESISNYNDGRFKTAIMPLFAMFDNVITLWYKEGLNDTRKQKYIPKLWQTVDGFQNDYSDALTSRVMYLPILIIMMAYKSFFNSRSTNTDQLNRNAIMHGSYNYELIDKISYLKLIIVLKELTYLEAVSFKEIKEYQPLN